MAAILAIFREGLCLAACTNDVKIFWAEPTGDVQPASGHFLFPSV
jgi:hypothetical protein